MWVIKSENFVWFSGLIVTLYIFKDKCDFFSGQRKYFFV